LFICGEVFSVSWKSDGGFPPQSIHCWFFNLDNQNFYSRCCVTSRTLGVERVKVSS
jgi:hypothetical protein